MRVSMGERLRTIAVEMWQGERGEAVASVRGDCDLGTLGDNTVLFKGNIVKYESEVRRSCDSPSSLSRTIMSISLLSNAYLDEALARTRGKPVPWEVIILFDPFCLCSFPL